MRWRRALIPLALAGLTAGLTAPTATQAARAATTSPTASLAESAVGDTALGTARTLNVPGGGYAVVHAFGSVSVVGASGQTQWQLDTQQLYKDWAVTWQPAQSFTEYPQLAWGTDPVDPLEFVGEANGLINDANPAATGVLDGRPVVAVAETVGVNMSPEAFIGRCLGCSWPFTVPGSSLHMGTFVSVLDARTGQMIYHEVDPGFVTQVAIAGGRLIVGDETGDPQRQNGIGQWGSVSTVRALAISADGTARQAWRYSTGVPWGRLLDVAVTDAGQQPGVAIAWSDTPPGLGVPGPPEGHMMLLDAATGAVRWQVRTPGYPVLAAADDQRGELAVVQQTDPAQSVGYTLTGLSYTSGRIVLSTPGAGVLPMSLAVGSGAEDGWAVAGMDATLSSDGYYYIPSGGQVTLTDPATGRQLWLDKLPESQDGPPYPDGLAITKGTVVVGAFLNVPTPTPSNPAQVEDTITALDYRTDHTDWQYAGDSGDPLSLSTVATGPGLIRVVTSHQDVETYAADGGVSESTAGPGDFLSGATASITAPGRTDLVAGNENGDVSAFDGRALAAGTEKVLWHAHLPGPVQHIVTATLGGRQVLVAAATRAIGVLDARTGRLLRLIRTPGTFAYTATVISAAGTPAVVVPGSSLTAYDLSTGARLWSHTAPSGASFSDAAYADGVVAAEYSSAASGGTSATEMAAVGVSAATGNLIWSQAADPSTVLRGQLWNGTFASPDIAGAGGNGVAFAWERTDGDGGQVDVRDIATGALRYSDTSPEIDATTQLLASPGLGLIAVAQGGAALITPSGAEASYYPYGISGALVTTPSGQEGFLTADGGVTAYGTDIFTTSSPSPLASAGIYQSGTLVSGDFAGNGTQQAVAMPADWLGYMIVSKESGYPVPPNLVTVQHGLAMLTLQDSGTSSSAAKAAAAPSSGPAQAAAYPAPPSGSKQSVNQPSGSQSAGLRPVGEAGSVTPVTEPARTGTITPETSPVRARHTITAHGADAAVTPPGYSPAQMAAYLKLTGDGKGQTIAIVDAYNDPNIVSDAETFSQQYGLPGVCGSGGTPGDCFTLDVKQQSASAGSDPGWALETSLDVEWAHAIAPAATIKLVEASEADFASLFRGVATAAATHPAAVSMSWGYGGGEFSDETYYDHFCALSTTVCVVSSGDYGHPGGYPAYNPAVLAVGGTTLNLAADGTVSSEQAWNSSGGGQSWVEPEPGYQGQAQSSGMREMPDVAFDGDPSTGVAVYDSVPYGGQSGWYEVGGTSVGAPSWSAILSDTDQLRAASAQPPLTAAGFAAQRAVYSLPSSALAPVTGGPDNGFCPDGCMPGPGYDEITGLGSPRAGIDSALATAKG
ncbi:MAG TPA: PQQ-binding-like beta-propeller repeat protein [Trebonia sp.]